MHHAVAATEVCVYGWLTGDLRFEDVSLRYFPGAPLALRHVDFHVQSFEKVSRSLGGRACSAQAVCPPDGTHLVAAA